MYFSTNPLFDTPLIRKVLSFDRFCLIEKFLHFVDNSSYSPNMTSLQFRESIIKESIVKYHESIEKKRSRTQVLPSPLRLIERHFVDAIPATEKNMKPSRRCVVCSENKIRSDTRYVSRL